MSAITVLMSVHETGPHLRSAIGSILRQTHRDFEFLIMDDGSSDETSAILDAYRRNDSRIAVERLEQNRGLGYALAHGMELATTPYVARMDGDDIAEPERLAIQLAYMDRNADIDILGSNARDIDERGIAGALRSVPASSSEIARLIWSCPIIHPTVMLRRQRILSVGNYDRNFRRRQDYELWFRAVKHGLKFANLPEPLLRYRFSAESMRRTSWNKAWQQARIGWNGCHMIGASPIAYVGVAYPLVAQAFPVGVRSWMRGATRRLDPRSQPCC